MERRGTVNACRNCSGRIESPPRDTCTATDHAAYFKRREHVRAENRTANRSRWVQRLKVVDMLGGRCTQCGFADPRALQINHVNGAGTLERETTSSAGFIRAIIAGRRGIDDLDLRCANCIVLYEYEVGRRAIPPDLLENRLAAQSVILPSLRAGTVDDAAFLDLITEAMTAPIRDPDPPGWCQIGGGPNVGELRR